MHESRALTLWQPWASLVALGVKSIETRSWSTSYRGPLLIHAATSTAGLFDRVSGTRWELVPIAAQHGITQRTHALPGFTAKNGYRKRPTAYLGSRPLPLGAVVAVADLMDVVPMVGERVGIIDTPLGRWLYVPPGKPHLTMQTCDGYGLTDHPVMDQRPYGDFAPGRFAWLLDNVRALPSPVPAKGRQGLWTPDPEVVAAVEGAVA